MNKQKAFQELLKKRGIKVREETPIVPSSGEPRPFPLSSAQRRIWFLHQFESSGGAYNDPTALRIRGRLDLEILEKTFVSICQRHSILRVTFEPVGGEPFQKIAPDFKLPLKTMSPDHVPGESLDEKINNFVNRQSSQRFDISSEPLICLSILLISPVDFVLVANVHHIVLDGWSKGVMLNEMMALYHALERGERPQLPELHAQYGDYVNWQQEWLQGAEYREQFEFWKQQLEGALPVLELPGDKARPAIPSGRGSLVPFHFDRDTLVQMNNLARRSNATLFMLILSAFNILLYRYTDETDILVGTPVAGRNRPEWEALIGLFVNTVVIRNDLAGDTAFAQLLEKVKHASLAAFSHQDFPFEKLVEELNPRRSVNITPLFQVMLQLQNAPMPPAEISGVTITPVQVDTGFAQVDLSLTMWEEGDLKGTFEYSADLFCPETIGRMAGHFKELIFGILENPGEKIGLLPMVTDAEREQLLVAFNQTQREFPDNVCIHELFAGCAGRYGDNVAIMTSVREMTYRELHRQSNRLARLLGEHDIQPETLAGICLEDPLLLVVGIMAILKAGGAYIPLDRQYPGDRLRLMLRDSGAAVLITDSGGASKFDNFSGHILCLDDEGRDFSVFGMDEPDLWATPEDVACVIYTSGSTGIPKGILLEHRGIVNLIESFRLSYSPGPNDRILPLTSIASASFVGELLPILCTGGAVVLAEKIHYLDLQRLKSLVMENRITIFSTVPSMIARLNSDDWDTGTLRFLLSGGEALVPGDIDRLSGSLSIVNGYGLTETTICSTFEILDPAVVDSSGVTVGRPVVNTVVYVLDKNLQPQPPGVAGEIYIGGAGVSRGYLNDPEATHERFVQNPFKKPGSPCRTKLFKSGDRGIMLPDGRLKFLGRLDSQVQIHGFRIELGEIEGCLGSHPDVEDQVVIARDFGDGDERLVAYIKLKDTGATPAGDYRDWLTQRLPEHMVPGIFEFIENIPLTVNGKVNVAALPVPRLERPGLQQEYIAPQTGREAGIAGIWREFLKLDRVGIDDNFFDLGGHSLMLAQVHDRLNKMFPRGITIIDLFRFPTIRSLAQFIGDDAQPQLSLDQLYSRADKRRNFLSRQTKNRRRQ